MILRIGNQTETKNTEAKASHFKLGVSVLYFLDIELLALVLFRLNTANIRISRTSRLKVHAHRRELFCRLLICRSLGSNPNGKQASERLHAFFIDNI